MKVQKFRARTSMEALAKVKEALGEEAVILSTRRVKEGGKWLYEMTAAVDFDPPEPSLPPRREGFSLVLRELEELKALLKGLEASMAPRSTFFELLVHQGVPPLVLKNFSANGDFNKEGFLKQLKARVTQRVDTAKLAKVLVYFGPAGVGKTTSLVKLAARLRFNGHKVALLSLDTVRVGAREQISRFAELLDLPLRFSRPEEFGPTLKELASWDYVLVDTPALSPSFSEKNLRELAETSPRVSLSLVLRACEAPQNVFSLWQRLKVLPVASLVLTHVEAMGCGGPLFWLFLPGLPPVRFLSTGDRVPEDFEQATPKRLMGLLLHNLEMEESYVV